MSRPAPRLRGPLTAFAAPVAAIGILAAALLAPDWSEALFTAGVYRASWGVGLGVTDGARARSALPRWVASERLLFYREGLHSVVSVHAQREDPSIITLKVNGKPDASTSVDIATQIALGDLPMSWAPPDAEVCVIGLGSGVTVRSVLVHDPRSVRVVEIEPAVVAAARFFDAATDSVLTDPRVHVVIEDGRQHLARSGQRYDVIVSEPSNPWIAGVNNLFTADFYRRVRRALRPGGVFCQWVQLYELSPPAASSLVRTFAHVFPEAEAFAISTTGDLLLIAMPPGARVPGERLFSPPGSARARFLERSGVHGDGATAGYHIGTVRSLAERLGPAPLNTDDRPYVEYRAPFDLYRVPAPLDPWRLAEPRPLRGLARWVDAGALPRVALAAGEQLVRVGLTPRAQALIADLDAAGGDFAASAEGVRQASVRAGRAAEARVWMERAAAAFADGDAAATEAALARVLSADAGNPAAHLLAARLAILSGRITEARQHLEVAIRGGDTRQRCDAFNLLGVIAMRERQLPEGRAYFEAARAVYATDPSAYVNLARWHLEREQPDSAAWVLQRGIAVAEPRDPVQEAYRALSAGEVF